MCVCVCIYIYTLYVFIYTFAYTVSNESQNEALYCSNNIQQLYTVAVYRATVRHVLRTTDLQCYRTALEEAVISLISVPVKQLGSALPSILYWKVIHWNKLPSVTTEERGTLCEVTETLQLAG